MKKLVFLIVVLLIAASAALAQEKKLRDAPASFQKFFATFKKTAEKGQLSKIADMVRFPFKYAIDAGEENQGTVKTKAKFIAMFRGHFGKEQSRYMTDEYLTFSRDEDGTYQVSSSADATHLIFVKVGKSYKFTAYYAEP